MILRYVRSLRRVMMYVVVGPVAVICSLRMIKRAGYRVPILGFSGRLPYNFDN